MFKKILFIFLLLNLCFTYNSNATFKTLESKPPSSLNINSKNAIILDRNSSTVLFGKHEYEKCRMASTTKIMTAIIVLENCSNLQEEVTISSHAARYHWFSTRPFHKRCYNCGKFTLRFNVSFWQ